MAALALSQREERKLALQLEKYLKGRLYWNSALDLGEGWVSGLLKDHGPVDLEILNGDLYAKEPTMGAEYLRDMALKKIQQ